MEEFRWLSRHTVPQHVRTVGERAEACLADKTILRLCHRLQVHAHKLFLVLAVSLVVWGALSFGAVYPWAYWPLLVGSVAVGLLGMFMPASRAAPLNRPITLSLAVLVLAVVLQLVPVPRDVILWINPEADAYLRQTDLAYALQLSAGESVWHPLSIRPDRTLLGLAFLTAFGLLLLGTERAFSVIRRRWFTGALVVFGVILALIGIVQKGLMVDKPYGFWEPVDVGAFFPFGPFVNRNHFAGWMAMALPLSIGHFGALVARGMPGVRPGWRNRLVWFSTPAASASVLTGLGVLVISLSLVMTLSRSGLVCFFVAMALLGGLWLRQNATLTSRALGVAYVSAVLIGAIGWTGIDAIAARLEQAQTYRFAGRLGAWADAVDIATAFPLTGTGLNTYGFATLVYQKRNLSYHYVQVHNDYLQLVAEGGVLLAIPAFGLFSVVIYQLAGVLRRDTRSRPDRTTSLWIPAGAVTGLIAIGVQEIVDFSLQLPGNAVLFTLVLGLALAHREHHHPQPDIVKPHATGNL